MRPGQQPVDGVAGVNRRHRTHHLGQRLIRHCGSEPIKRDKRAGGTHFVNQRSDQLRRAHARFTDERNRSPATFRHHLPGGLQVLRLLNAGGKHRRRRALPARPDALPTGVCTRRRAIEPTA